MEHTDASPYAFTLGDRMRKAAEVAGLTNTDIADQLGVERRTPARWIAGRTSPSMRTLMAWAKVTGAPLEWLLEGDQARRADVA